MLERRRVVAALGAYYVATGATPFVSRAAFEAVTGRKREWWLVQTVGALVTVVGGVLVGAAGRDRVTPENRRLGSGVRDEPGRDRGHLCRSPPDQPGPSG